MFLQIKDSRDLVKIVDVQELFDPTIKIVHAQDQEGQEEQETDIYKKEELISLWGKITTLLVRCPL